MANKKSDKVPDRYKTGQDNINPFGLDIHNPVFVISSVSILIFVVGTVVFQQQAAIIFAQLRNFITSSFDWFFLSAGNVFLIFALVLVCLPVGKIRLGGRNAKPEFSYPAGCDVVHAGMASGLLYFGVSNHLTTTQPLRGPRSRRIGIDGFRAMTATSTCAARACLAATLFSLGLHPWAYSNCRSCIGILLVTRGFPPHRSAFYPISENRVKGGVHIKCVRGPGDAFRSRDSLGLGICRRWGIQFLSGWGTGSLAVIALISSLRVAVVSVIRDCWRGSRTIDDQHGVAVFCDLLVVAVPTAAIVATSSAAQRYVRDVVPLSLPFGRDDLPFVQGWTSFYWAWWVSWSPFVGMFIARISKGRTVREFIAFVILVPTVFSMVWMSSFGGTALSQLMSEASTAIGDAAQEIKMFHMFVGLPLTGLLSLTGVMLVLVFFVTSSDSGSLVVDTITAGGKTDVPVQQRVFWAITEGIVAIVLLLVGGKAALEALQAMTVSAGLPFTIVLLVMCVSIWLGLRSEIKRERATEPEDRQ